MLDSVTDLLVLGSGVAGLSAAVRARRAGLSVTVLTKGELGWSATRYAQGGVAAALIADDDSPELHGSDTLAAGGGLCDTDAVRVLASEGPARVRELMALGAHFDEVDGRRARAGARGRSLGRPGRARGRRRDRRRDRAGAGRRGAASRAPTSARAGSPPTCSSRTAARSGVIARRPDGAPRRPRATHTC